jgi:hypothetical protein
MELEDIYGLADILFFPFKRGLHPLQEEYQKDPTFK